MDKTELKRFGERLFFTLHLKINDYYSLDELISDFRRDNGFNPDERAKTLGYPSLQNLLETREMFDYVNVVKRVDENGQRITLYSGRHMDSLNALKSGQRLEKQEMERRQNKKQFWQQELNKIPPSPNIILKGREPLKSTQCQKSFLQQIESEKENYPQPFEKNQNVNISRNQGQRPFYCPQQVWPSSNNYLRPRENKLHSYHQSSPIFSSSTASEELIRRLEITRDEEKRRQKQNNYVNNIQENCSKTSKKDVAAATNMTCRNCVIVKRVLARLIGRINSLEKEKQKNDEEIIQINDKSSSKISNIGTVPNIFEESEEVGDLIDLSSTRTSARQIELEIGRNSAVDSPAVRNAFTSFWNESININNEEIEENINNISQIAEKFCKEQLQNKQAKRKAALPGKGSSVFPWGRKFYKKCPLCSSRQTLEHVMLIQHESIEESNEEIDEAEDEEKSEEENEEDFIDENSDLNLEGQIEENSTFEQEENEHWDNIVEESDLIINGGNERRENDVEEDNDVISFSDSSNTEDEENKSNCSNEGSEIIQNSTDPSYCNICNQQFSSPRGLSIHKGKSKMHRDLLLTAHGMASLVVSNSNTNNSNLFKCNSPGCNSTFESSDQLKRHQLRLHKTRDFICHCGKRYVKEGGLRKHKIEKNH